MPQASTTLHEPVEKLKPETINFHRAMVSADGRARSHRLVSTTRRSLH